MRLDVDIAVVGSGFAGSLIAMIARRLGRSVALLERGRHPRFAIGESSTPLANLLLEQLARRYGVPGLEPLTKWGSWQDAHPEIPCGLKRGFSFYHHRWGEAFADDASHARQLLVAASPNDEVADTHWFRPEFDRHFVGIAQSLGVEYRDRVQLEAAAYEGESIRLTGHRGGESVEVVARFVIDASGPRGFLHRTLGLEEVECDLLPPTEALFAHFEGVERFSSETEAPFLPDDAALHHLFPGGWIWVLRFNHGVTSAGVAATAAVAREFDLREGASAWWRLLGELPSVRDQFSRARPVLPFVHMRQVAFRTERAAGRQWALLPSAAGFVDPLLSTGFPLTLLGVERLAALLERNWGGADFAAGLTRYSEDTLEELRLTEALVAALYSNFAEPEMFRGLTLLYFAAAVYAETARRLHSPERAPGFLLHRREVYGRELRRCLESARVAESRRQKDDLLARIRALVEPIDLGGFGESSRRNWYPVLAKDALANAWKAGASEEQMRALLLRSGWQTL